MKEAMENFELIEQYCEDKLNGEQRANFESRLLTDGDLKEEFELYKNIVSGIKESGRERLKGKLIIADEELDSKVKIITFKKEKINYLKIGSIAASIMLIVGLGVYYMFFNTNNYPELASKYYEPEKGLPVEMSVNSNQLDGVMNDYKTGNYTGAKNKIEKIAESTTNDTLRYFYGVINFELQNYNDAISSFSLVTSSGDYFDKAQYRLVLAYLKINDKPNALKIINEALSNKEHKFYAKLSELKKELTQ